MIIACIVLSSLALLAAVANIILFVTEKKRVESWRRTMVDFVAAESKAVSTAASMYTEEFTNKAIEEAGQMIAEDAESRDKMIAQKFEDIHSEIEKLKSGLAPDYEKALVAAKAVNDFNTGLSAIMNYDPIAAVRAQRQSGDKEADAWQE